jgi:hypothetical protein
LLEQQSIAYKSVAQEGDKLLARFHNTAVNLDCVSLHALQSRGRGITHGELQRTIVMYFMKLKRLGSRPEESDRLVSES